MSIPQQEPPKSYCYYYVLLGNSKKQANATLAGQPTPGHVAASQVEKPRDVEQTSREEFPHTQRTSTYHHAGVTSLASGLGLGTRFQESPELKDDFTPDPNRTPPQQGSLHAWRRCNEFLNSIGHPGLPLPPPAAGDDSPKPKP